MSTAFPDSSASPRVPLSLIDFATVHEGETSRDAFLRSVEMAQLAETLGYSRIWYSEHHNMKSIASSAPSVLISHIAAKTDTIRLGAGGVMLPNHAPLVIAEQYGTLAELYPDRIDLGLGRAPGTDQRTVLALRRDPRSAESFPDDVRELRGFLSERSRVAGVTAVPGTGTNVPLYILGSSLFGAQLAATLGVPYSFASHFAPDALTQAVTAYRENYQPSPEHPEPYVIAAVNVTAADSEAEATAQHEQNLRQRVKTMALRGRSVTEEELDMVMSSPAAEQILSMMRYTAVGTGSQVSDYLSRFAEHAQADELMVAIQSPSTAGALRAMEITAESWGL